MGRKAHPREKCTVRNENTDKIPTISAARRRFCANRHRLPVYCVQSWRASRNARDVAGTDGVLHATNGGLTRGMTLRAIQTPSACTGLRFPTGSALRGRLCPARDIACKPLPYVFARMGLPAPLGAPGLRSSRRFRCGKYVNTTNLTAIGRLVTSRPCPQKSSTTASTR